MRVKLPLKSLRTEDKKQTLIAAVVSSWPYCTVSICKQCFVQDCTIIYVWMRIILFNSHYTCPVHILALAARKNCVWYAGQKTWLRRLYKLAGQYITNKYRTALEKSLGMLADICARTHVRSYVQLLGKSRDPIPRHLGPTANDHASHWRHSFAWRSHSFVNWPTH